MCDGYLSWINENKRRAHSSASTMWQSAARRRHMANLSQKTIEWNFSELTNRWSSVQQSSTHSSHWNLLSFILKNFFSIQLLLSGEFEIFETKNARDTAAQRKLLILEALSHCQTSFVCAIDRVSAIWFEINSVSARILCRFTPPSHHHHRAMNGLLLCRPLSPPESMFFLIIVEILSVSKRIEERRIAEALNWIELNKRRKKSSKLFHWYRITN